MIQLYLKHERIVTARSSLRMSQRLTLITRLACWPAVAALALAACSGDDAEPGMSAAGASGKSAAMSDTRPNAANGGGGASAGQSHAAAGSRSAAGQGGSATAAAGASGSRAAAGSGGDADAGMELGMDAPGALTQGIAT